MKFMEIKVFRNIFLFLLMVLVAFSITGISLFCLPSYYEQTAWRKVLLFLGVAVILFFWIYFANKTFIFPNIKQYLIKKNLIFLILMSLFLTVTFAISSANYWAVPEIHKVKLCFDAEIGSANLTIEKLVDPNTNRLYPPNSFGYNKYPIIIESGSCVNGRITILLSRLTQALLGFKITVNVQASHPAGRLYLSVNEVPAVVTFEKDSESQSVTEIILKDGFDKGMKIDSPWRQYWFIGWKALGILIGGIYISLFLFGLTEKIISPQSSENSLESKNI